MPKFQRGKQRRGRPTATSLRLTSLKNKVVTRKLLGHIATVGSGYSEIGWSCSNFYNFTSTRHFLKFLWPANKDRKKQTLSYKAQIDFPACTAMYLTKFPANNALESTEPPKATFCKNDISINHTINYCPFPLWENRTRTTGIPLPQGPSTKGAMSFRASKKDLGHGTSPAHLPTNIFNYL